MASVTVASGRSAISAKRATVFGVLFLVFGALCALLAMAASSGARTEFTLNDRTGDAISVSPITVPTRTAIIAFALVCAAIGIWQLTRGFGRRL